jgi:hypothetical protein
MAIVSPAIKGRGGLAALHNEQSSDRSLACLAAHTTAADSKKHRH